MGFSHRDISEFAIKSAGELFCSALLYSCSNIENMMTRTKPWIRSRCKKVVRASLKQFAGCKSQVARYRGGTGGGGSKLNTPVNDSIEWNVTLLLDKLWGI